MARSDVLDLGSDRLRIHPWRGDHSIAYVVPMPGRSPGPEGLRRCLDELRERGYRSALTSALGAGEQQAFLAAGFSVHEELHLLRHDLQRVPTPTATATLRRGRRRDEAAVLDVDRLAFDAFWRFDQVGLADARSATPVSRFRVADDGAVAGYAITGRAGRTGYLQRLAVHPRVQRQSLGSALVADALRWSARRGAAAVMVNTQADNHGALALYERLGFVREAYGLAVLERSLDWG